MDRAYFLLTGTGPELAAIEELEELVQSVTKDWHDFVDKYAEGRKFYHDNRLIGIAFEKNADVPKGWVNSGPDVYRPGKPECPEAYAEWKALPPIPTGDWLRNRLETGDVTRGNRWMWVAFQKTKAEKILFSSPISESGEFYIPKGEHEELNASRYIELVGEEA